MRLMVQRGRLYAIRTSFGADALRIREHIHRSHDCGISERPRILQHERQTSLARNGDPLPFAPADVDFRVALPQSAERRPDAESIGGSKPAVQHMDAPCRVCWARPLAYSNDESGTVISAEQADLENRTEHSFREPGRKMNPIAIELRVDLVDGLPDFDLAGATSLQ